MSIDACPGLGISPLRTYIWLNLSQANLGPKSAQEIFLGGFLKSLKHFFSKICAHSERYRNILAGIFEILTLCGNIAFPLSPVLAPYIASALSENGVLSSHRFLALSDGHSCRGYGVASVNEGGRLFRQNASQGGLLITRESGPHEVVRPFLSCNKCCCRTGVSHPSRGLPFRHSLVLAHCNGPRVTRTKYVTC